MRILILSLLLLISTKSIAESEEFTDHDTHQHGHAEVYISFIEQNAQIRLVLPSIDVFGYEHKPNNAQQLSEAQRQLDILDKLENIISIDDSCTQIHSEVESSMLADDSHNDSHEHDDEHHHDKAENHSNVIATYKLDCKSNTGIQMDFNIFKVYPSLEKLELQFVSNETQTATVMTPENSIYNLP